MLRPTTPLRLIQGLAGLTALLMGLTVSHAQDQPTDSPSTEQRAKAKAFPVKTTVGATFSTSAVFDEDPVNELGLTYFGKVGYKLTGWLSLSLNAAVNQSFVLLDEPTCGDLRLADPASCRGAADDAKPSEPEFQVTRNNRFELSDVGLGAHAKTPIPLTEELSIGVTHTLMVFAPTSWISRHRAMILAVRYQAAIGLPKLVKGLSLSLVPSTSYRFHQYAETIGAGAPITQLHLGTRLALGYTLPKFGRFGELSAGASVGTQYLRRYEMCAEKAGPDVTLEGTCGYAVDPTRWRQQWNWEAHLGYSVLGWLNTGLAMGHGEPVLRHGVKNIDFFDRNRTRLSFTLSGSF